MKNRLNTLPKLLVLAMANLPAAAFADAEEDARLRTIAELTQVTSSVSAGLTLVSDDSQRIGMYSGLNEEGANLSADINLARLDAATGTWLRLTSRDIGLPTMELRAEREQQGDWGVFIEHTLTPRIAPYDVHTAVTGIGTATLAVPVPVPAGSRTTAAETEIATERAKTTFGLSKTVARNWEFSARFQSEEKTGSRLFGRGTPGLQEFLAEPIDSLTRQLDLTGNYTGDRLQMSAGYYGSFFNNMNSALFVNGGSGALASTTAPNVPFNPIALPPDNEAHQFHLSGAYSFTDTTRGTFKLAKTKATQEDDFIPMAANGSNISGRTNLGGRVDTTQAKIGITSRPIANLSLLGNLRYEDRDDKTEVATYLAAGSSTDGTNEPRSLKTTAGKLEASYRLPYDIQGTLGYDREKKERSTSGIRVVGYREETDEDALRLELRKTFSEGLNGSIAISDGERDGTPYITLTNCSPAPCTASNRIQPIYIADRERTKVKLTADWTPTDELSLQFVFEDSFDRYGAGRDVLDIGPRNGDAQLYSIDAAYALSDDWQLTAYASRFDTEIDQATATSAPTPVGAANVWTANSRNVGETVGLGLRGKLNAKWDLGGDVLLARDDSYFRFGGAATTDLPDIHNRALTVKLYGRYAIDKATTLRLDYVRERRKTDDWTWNGTAANAGYTYTDGTWLYQDPDESVSFVGMTLQYVFH